MHSSQSWRMRRAASLAVVLLALTATSCLRRPPQVFVPVQSNAQQQYAYAVNYRDQHQLVLRNKAKRTEWERARAAVWEAFEKVVTLYPEDLVVTPLARLELADMRAGLDYSGATPSKDDLRWAIDRLREIQRDYPAFDFVQAKARYDEALCWKALERYDRSQVLFKEVIDTYGTHRDPTIRGIVERANLFYQRTYIR
jgi:hypothetical protein